MTDRQQRLLNLLNTKRANLEARRKRLALPKRTIEQIILDAIIATFLQDVAAQRDHTRELAVLQREKSALTAELHASDRSLLATTTYLTLLAALRSLERQRHVHRLRRVAATAALALHEQAARAFLRTLNRALAAERGEECVAGAR